MSFKEIAENYEYLEQMLSIYEQKQKNIKKRFSKMQLRGEAIHIIEFLKLFIPANIIIFFIDYDFMMKLDALKLARNEICTFIISYILCRIADKSIGLENFEHEDLEQLEIDLYDYQEKEKGCYAQIKQCSRQYLNERQVEKAKVYAKR